MEIIQELSDYIEEEINDAIKYAKMAIARRDEYPLLAEAVYKISDEEIKHMGILHGQVAAIIADYRKKNGEPPEPMQVLYNVLHRKHIEHAAEAKAYQSLFKD